MFSVGNVVVLVSISMGLLLGQPSPPCDDEDISRFPAYGMQEAARGHEARFELRRCGAIGIVRVLMFERGAMKPSVDFPLVDTWPTIYHYRNVLVVQAPGGVSSVVRVFWFRRGKAQVPVAEDTQGNFRAQVIDQRMIAVDVPPHRGRPTTRRLRFPLEFTLWQSKD